MIETLILAGIAFTMIDAYCIYKICTMESKMHKMHDKLSSINDTTDDDDYDIKIEF